MTLRRTAAALAPLATLIALAGCAARQPPPRYFQPSSEQIGPELNSYGQAVIPRHGLVVIQGDDLAYGLARGRSRYRINDAVEGQAHTTLSETLRRAVKGVRVENRGFPGDTVAASAARWASAPRADLAILCFGFGDAAAHTPPATFQAELSQLIAAYHAMGAAVFVVTPPSSSDRFAQSNLAVYQALAGSTATASGAVAFATDASMQRIKAAHVKTTAQASNVYEAVAADISPYVKVVDAPPQVGQVGSADRRTVRVSASSAS